MDDIPSEVINCDDILDIIPIVFSQPPKPPHSFRFDTDYSSVHDLFRVLGLFLTHGISYLFGEDQNIASLSSSNILTLQQYLNSIGWQAVINPKKDMKYTNALPFMLKIPIPQTTDFVIIIFEPYKI